MRLGWHRRIEGQALIGGKGGRPLRVEHPHRGIGRALGCSPFEVPTVGEAIVRRPALRDTCELGDLRVAPVGADHELGVQLDGVAMFILDRHAADAPPGMEQLSGALAEHQIDSRRLASGSTDERIEVLATQA